MSKQNNHREVYLINSNSTNTKFSICKVLNEYTSKDVALEDIKKLMGKEINEDDLLNELDNKGL